MTTIDLTSHWVGYLAIVVFVTAYGFVAAEEYTHLRKSKPVILAAGIIWTLIAIIYAGQGENEIVGDAVRDFLLEFSELFLPAVVNFVVPAFFMQFAIGNEKPESQQVQFVSSAVPG